MAEKNKGSWLFVPRTHARRFFDFDRALFIQSCYTHYLPVPFKYYSPLTRTYIYLFINITLFYTIRFDLYSNPCCVACHGRPWWIRFRKPLQEFSISFLRCTNLSHDIPKKFLRIKRDSRWTDLTPEEARSKMGPTTEDNSNWCPCYEYQMRYNIHTKKLTKNPFFASLGFSIEEKLWNDSYTQSFMIHYDTCFEEKKTACRSD